MFTDIFQPTHLLFVLVVALLVLGPKRLPEVARQLGNGIRDFRNAINGERNERPDEISSTYEQSYEPPKPPSYEPSQPPSYDPSQSAPEQSAPEQSVPASPPEPQPETHEFPHTEPAPAPNGTHAPHPPDSPGGDASAHDAAQSSASSADSSS